MLISTWLSLVGYEFDVSFVYKIKPSPASQQFSQYLPKKDLTGQRLTNSALVISCKRYTFQASFIFKDFTGLV
jgi:hypothetical protein